MTVYDKSDRDTMPDDEIRQLVSELENELGSN